jgi:ATPase subunit of ABC transporter with duplicated ATPase domains
LLYRLQYTGPCSHVVRELAHNPKVQALISIALVHRPEVIVVDEPMVGLDPRSIRLLKDLLRKEASQGTPISIIAPRQFLAEAPTGTATAPSSSNPAARSPRPLTASTASTALAATVQARSFGSLA